MFGNVLDFSPYRYFHKILSCNSLIIIVMANLITIPNPLSRDSSQGVEESNKLCGEEFGTLAGERKGVTGAWVKMIE